MPGACSSSLCCCMVCVTCSTTPSHHSLSIIYIHYIYFEIESCIAIFLSFMRRPNQFSQQLGYWQESRGRVAHVSVLGSNFERNVFYFPAGKSVLEKLDGVLSNWPKAYS